MVLVMARPGAATCTVLRPLLEKLAATSRASEAATHLRTRRAGTCELDPDVDTLLCTAAMRTDTQDFGEVGESRVVDLDSDLDLCICTHRTLERLTRQGLYE